MKEQVNLFSAKLLITLSILFNLSFITGIEAQIKITDGSILTIDNNSLLEMESSNKGLLVPRVAINNFTQTDPLTAPVPEGMLVYSQSGLIPDGFYFWNGSKWVSMGISEIPVTKSATCTLLKSETLIMASGDITLTLPVVTASDNGLSITIKHTGTHLHLVNISGNSGATIDGITSSRMTRWIGKTFIALDGNWIEKTKQDVTENLFEISPSSSFTTIEEVVAFLNIHMSGPTVVRLAAGEHNITATQTIDLPYPVTFQGISFGETIIKAAAGVSGNVLFNCRSECYFKMLSLVAISNTAGNDAIHFTGSGAYHEVKDASIAGFNKGIVSTTNNDFWIFEVEFHDCPGAGIEIAAGSASGGRFRISESDFIECVNGINLLSGISQTTAIKNNNFYNKISSSEIGIAYHPDSFTSIATMMITNNGWNNEGIFVSGFDFSRPDGRDADAILVGNAGVEDSKPHCEIHVANNALITAITNSGGYYKASWINTSVKQSKWDVAENKMTYQSVNSSDGWAIISGNLSNSSPNHVVTLAVVKNGVTATLYGETSLRVITANQPFQFSTVVYFSNLSKNDFLELFVTSNTNSDIITFHDVHWFINTQ